MPRLVVFREAGIVPGNAAGGAFPAGQRQDVRSAEGAFTGQGKADDRRILLRLLRKRAVLPGAEKGAAVAAETGPGGNQAAAALRAFRRRAVSKCKPLTFRKLAVSLCPETIAVQHLCIETTFKRA